MSVMRGPGGSGRSGHESTSRVRRALVLVALALGATSVQGTSTSAPVAAVWKTREFNFLYQSSSTVYTCSALSGRVASILRAVGARDDLVIKVNDCSESFAPPGAGRNDGLFAKASTSPLERYPDRHPERQHVTHVYVRAMMPVEVTDAVLAELEKDKSRRELVSRVTGSPAARFNDPVVFPAQRQSVILSRRTIGIESTECELLEQLSSGVFRELDVSVVRRGHSCDPDRDSRIPPELEVEALLMQPR